MFEYMTERSVESKIQPGVKYQIKEVCNEVRDAILLESASVRGEVQRILVEAQEIQEALKTGGMKDSEKLDLENKATELNIQFEVSSRKASQIQARAMLVGVEGMLMNGKPPAPELFISRGPEKLVEELYGIASTMLGLTQEERKNSPSPITSPAQEDGATSDMTVLSAA